MRSDTSHKRHIAKAITWRIIGTLDTMALAWLISGNPLTGVKVGVAEVLTKMILYYFHERLWCRSAVRDSRKRHLLTTVSWRMVGTMDTMLLAWLISGTPFIGVKIGLAEVLTKMILYYLHERVWYLSDFGLPERSLRYQDKNVKKSE